MAILKTLMDRHGIRAKKSLGQHFLLNPQITGRIAGLAEPLAGSHVVEIGPGPGGLTIALLERGAELIAIEKDKSLLGLLAEMGASFPGQLTVLERDALQVNVTELVPEPRQIISNLPYNIGTALLIDWLYDIERLGPSAYQRLTLMFQKEVAERLYAEPGTKAYGRLSVLTQWLCDIEACFTLPPGAFSPPPKVESTVVQLTPRTKRRGEVKREMLEKVLAAAFNQRRKMLRASLKALGVDTTLLLEQAAIKPELRAENLSVEDFVQLAQTYERLATKA